MGLKTSVLPGSNRNSEWTKSLQTPADLPNRTSRITARSSEPTNEWNRTREPRTGCPRSVIAPLGCRRGLNGGSSPGSYQGPHSALHSGLTCRRLRNIGRYTGTWVPSVRGAREYRLRDRKTKAPLTKHLNRREGVINLEVRRTP